MFVSQKSCWRPSFTAGSWACLSLPVCCCLKQECYLPWAQLRCGCEGILHTEKSAKITGCHYYFTYLLWIWRLPMDKADPQNHLGSKWISTFRCPGAPFLKPDWAKIDPISNMLSRQPSQELPTFNHWTLNSVLAQHDVLKHLPQHPE